MDLVDELELFRETLKLSQRQFVLKAEIDPAAWNRVVNRIDERKITAEMKLHFLRAYPQLAGKIISDVMG